MSATLSCKVLLVWTAVPLYNYMPTHTTSHTIRSQTLTRHRS